MVYSLNRLMTIADCDIIIQLATDEKDFLVHKQTNVDYNVDSYTGRSDEVEAALTATNTELVALEAAYPTMPVGSKGERDMEKRIQALKYQKFLLEKRSDSYNALQVIQRELELGRVEAELAEIDTFIAAVEAHKVTLV